MVQEPLQALRAASRVLPVERRPRLLMAGATGALGTEVLRQLAGAFDHTEVLAREPMTTGLRRVAVLQVPGDAPEAWPAAHADVGVVLFDPPRLFYDRERALWTPTTAQLPAVAGWMRRSGVRTIAVVMPHDQGRLPESLKRGLAGEDELAVAALGFDRVILLRSARKPQPEAAASVLQRIARFMLSVFKYMLPSSEQPVRALKVAQLLAAALQLAPRGIHIAPPELVWRAGQGDVRAVASEWLAPR